MPTSYPAPDPMHAREGVRAAAPQEGAAYPQVDRRFAIESLRPSDPSTSPDRKAAGSSQVPRAQQATAPAPAPATVPEYVPDEMDEDLARPIELSLRESQPNSQVNHSDGSPSEDSQPMISELVTEFRPKLTCSLSNSLPPRCRQTCYWAVRPSEPHSRPSLRLRSDAGRPPRKRTPMPPLPGHPSRHPSHSASAATQATAPAQPQPPQPSYPTSAPAQPQPPQPSYPTSSASTLYLSTSLPPLPSLPTFPVSFRGGSRVRAHARSAAHELEARRHGRRTLTGGPTLGADVGRACVCGGDSG